MRDNHGHRYNPTEKTLVGTAPDGEQLHRKQTGEHFLFDGVDKITPLDKDAALRWMQIFMGGIAAPKSRVTSVDRITLKFRLPERFVLAILHTGKSPKVLLMENLYGELSAKLPPYEDHDKRMPRSITMNFYPDEYQQVTERATELGLSRSTFAKRVLAHVAMKQYGY